MNTYKHIFFDLDRTLWDYDRNSYMALQDLYDLHKLDRIFGQLDFFWKSFNLYNDQLWDDYREGKIKKESLRIKRFTLAMEEFGYSDPDLAETLNTSFLKICPYKNFLMEGRF